MLFILDTQWNPIVCIKCNTVWFIWCVLDFRGGQRLLLFHFNDVSCLRVCLCFSIVPPSSLDGMENWDGNLVLGIEGSLSFFFFFPDGLIEMHLGRRVWARQWWGGSRSGAPFRVHSINTTNTFMWSDVTLIKSSVPVFRLLIAQFGRRAELLCQNEGGAHGSLFVTSVLPTLGGSSFDLTVWLPEVSYIIEVGPFQSCMSCTQDV